MTGSQVVAVVLVLAGSAACSSGRPEPTTAPPPTVSHPITASVSQPAVGRLVLTVLLTDPCPSEPVVPDPACEPQPLPGAPVSLIDRSGRQVAAGVSDARGQIVLDAPPGRYRLRAGRFDHFTPPPEWAVEVGPGETVIDVPYAALIQ